MKKVLAWLLVLSLTAAISIGATLAYLTDTDEDVNVMTLGKVKIDQLEYERIDDETADEKAEVQEFRDNKPLLPAVTDKDFTYTPGDTYVDWDQIGKDGYTSDIWDPSKINNEVDKMVFIKNTGDYDAFVRSVFAFEAGKYSTLDQFKSMVHLNLNETDYTWEWVETPVTIGKSTYFVATATYNKVLAPGALTEISLSQIALDKTATNEDVEAFGETYNVLVKSQGIQADGFDTAKLALDEGFGPITASAVPFKTDEPIQGVKVRDALYYLNGDPTGTKIASKVTNVYFALKKNHPNVVNQYEGVLLSEEQDVEVYAYYVPNGDYYDLYFLANGKICWPKNSKELFYPMSQLKTVDTSNLSTAKVEDMTDTFYNCKNLVSIDVSHWDVSNVKSMYGTFCACNKLESLDTKNWDTGNVTNFRALFSGCTSLTSLDVSGWDTSSATTFRNLFYNCNKLKNIVGIGNWDTSSVTDMDQTFLDCMSLEELDVGSWNVSNVTDMSFLFRGCFTLEELNIDNWNTGKVVEFNSMFSSNSQNSGNMNLKKLPVANWNMSSATDISYMFYGCGNVTEVDLSKWNVSKVTTMYHTFADCNKMERYNFSGWNTESLQIMDGIFNSNLALKVVDVSDFDTANVTDFDQVFDGCTSLEQIIGLDKWDTSKGQYFREFLLNTKVVAIDLSAFNMSSAIRTQNMFHVNSKLTTIYVGDNWNLNPDQLTDTGMFGSSPKLTGGNGSTISSIGSNSGVYARVDLPAVVDAEGNVIAEAVPGLLTHIKDKI